MSGCFGSRISKNGALYFMMLELYRYMYFFIKLTMILHFYISFIGNMAKVLPVYLSRWTTEKVREGNHGD